LPLGISIKVLSKSDVGFFPFENTNNVDLEFEKLNNMELHHKIQIDYIAYMNELMYLVMLLQCVVCTVISEYLISDTSLNNVNSLPIIAEGYIYL
jgi:hypothetical protein